MKKWELKNAKGFDPRTQRKLSFLVAQLDEQLAACKKTVKDLTVKQLQWQYKPGMNTIDAARRNACSTAVKAMKGLC